MEASRTVIKRTAIRGTVSRVEGEGFAEAMPVRIGAERVQKQAGAWAAEEAHEEAEWRGVLRGGATSASIEPYVMMELDLAPAFPLPEVEPQPLDAPEPEPEPDRATVEAAWQARLDEAVAHARAEAYEEGYVAAEAALQASFEQRQADLHADAERLQATWKDFLKKTEPLMVSLAFEVARQLLEAPLPQDVRAVSAQALAQAIDQFGEAHPLDVTLHPDDHARLQAYGLIDDLDDRHPGIRWTPDEAIPVGDWVIQSPEAAVRRLKDEMFSQLKSRFGLLAVMKKRDG